APVARDTARAAAERIAAPEIGAPAAARARGHVVLVDPRDRVARADRDGRRGEHERDGHGARRRHGTVHRSPPGAMRTSKGVVLDRPPVGGARSERVTHATIATTRPTPPTTNAIVETLPIAFEESMSCCALCGQCVPAHSVATLLAEFSAMTPVTEPTTA